MDLQQIINSFQANDNVAFRYLYTTHGAYCVNSLKKYRNCEHEEAEDLFIDAVMLFRDKIESGKVTNLSSLQTFLYKICENNYLARLKKERSRKQKLSDVEFYFYESDYVSEDENEFSDMLSNAAKKAWEKLSEKCKDIISYFYIDKLRMEKIAELMEFSTSDVAKTTKSRCYKTLVNEARNFKTSFES